MTGGHLRDLYADFLDEAAGWLGADALRGPAEAFRAAARAWEHVAEVALPDEVPHLAKLRELTAAVRQAVADPANTSREEADRAAADLWAIREQVDRDPRQGIDEDVAPALFERLGAAIGEAHARESEAIRALAAIPL